MRGSRRLPVLTLVLAATFFLLTAIVASGGFLGVDAAAQPWFTGQASSDVGDPVLGGLAAMGELQVAGAVLTVAVLWRCWSLRRLAPALAAVVAAAGTALSVVAFKAAVGRSAPGAGLDDVLVGGRSYPSGHAATAAVCLLLGALLLGTGRGARWDRAIVVLAVALSLAVAWATVALGFHWVSDVVGGLLVAAAWATGVRRWVAPDTVSAAQRPGR